MQVRPFASMFLAASTRGIARRCLAVSFTDSKEILPIERITAHPLLLRYPPPAAPTGEDIACRFRPPFQRTLAHGGEHNRKKTIVIVRYKEFGEKGVDV